MVPNVLDDVIGCARVATDRMLLPMAMGACRYRLNLRGLLILISGCRIPHASSALQAASVWSFQVRTKIRRHCGVQSTWTLHVEHARTHRHRYR